MRERRRRVCIKCILSVDKKKINLHLRFTVTSNNTDVGCAYENDREKRIEGTYTRSVEMENRIGAPAIESPFDRAGKPTFVPPTNSHVRLALPFFGCPFRAVVLCPRSTGTFIPFRHHRRSCLIDRPETRGPPRAGKRTAKLPGVLSKVYVTPFRPKAAPFFSLTTESKERGASAC